MEKTPQWAYELKVAGTKPRDLPLEVLGELAKRLSDVLGSSEALRFVAVKQGSARLQVAVTSFDAQDAVRLRLLTTKAADSGPILKLNDFLAGQGWSADLRNSSGAVVVHFPGKPANADQFEPRVIKQLDHLVGSVSKIGGRDESVPMTLKLTDGTYLDVTVKGKAMARDLGKHLFGPDIRVSGLATWACDETGSWACQGMIISEFEVLSDESLAHLFDDLASVEGNGWKRFDDPVGELKRFRSDD